MIIIAFLHDRHAMQDKISHPILLNISMKMEKSDLQQMFVLSRWGSL